MALSQDEIDDLVRTAASAPKQVVSGTRSVTQHDPKAIADMANALAAQATAASGAPHRGIYITQLVPGGCG